MKLKFFAGLVIILGIVLILNLQSDEQVEQRFECPQEVRDSDACIDLHDPVCGWFKEEIKCVTYPCASTYSNSCFACIDDNVKDYTKGECPSPN